MKLLLVVMLLTSVLAAAVLLAVLPVRNPVQRPPLCRRQGEAPLYLADPTRSAILPARRGAGADLAGLEQSRNGARMART